MSDKHVRPVACRGKTTAHLLWNAFRCCERSTGHSRLSAWRCTLLFGCLPMRAVPYKGRGRRGARGACSPWPLVVRTDCVHVVVHVAWVRAALAAVAAHPCRLWSLQPYTKAVAAVVDGVGLGVEGVFHELGLDIICAVHTLHSQIACGCARVLPSKWACSRDGLPSHV